MRFPTVTLEGKKLPRLIFSIQPPTPHDREVYPLMQKVYEMGAWCFDLPSENHLKAFRELKHSTTDQMLIGLFHLEAEAGISYLGKPLHRFESKVISTIRKDLLPAHLKRNVLPPSSSAEVFTQKEIDRIAFDPVCFEEALSTFDPEVSPFLFLGEKYGDWILALGRIDLLHEMVSGIRRKGFLPIFTGQWATFVLPKAKPLRVAAYAIPINKRWSLFDLQRASDLIKKFDKPVISLDPLDDGNLLQESEKAFSFLFEELKICAAVAKIASEEEAGRVVEALKRFPSLIPPRKT
ncbi:MAG TPA: hypothetical protein VLZ03_07300 [Thermodesulfobacteriota bacterium]|nr:hypothetical protein [Thermodesulfobacteriota bacterium]